MAKISIPWKEFINWEALMAWVQQMFANCQAAPPAEQVELLRNPRPKHRLLATLHTRKGCLANGMKLPQWKDNKDAIMAEVYARGKEVASSPVALKELRESAKDLEATDEDEE